MNYVDMPVLRSNKFYEVPSHNLPQNTFQSLHIFHFPEIGKGFEATSITKEGISASH